MLSNCLCSADSLPPTANVWMTSWTLFPRPLVLSIILVNCTFCSSDIWFIANCTLILFILSRVSAEIWSLLWPVILAVISIWYAVLTALSANLANPSSVLVNSGAKLVWYVIASNNVSLSKILVRKSSLAFVVSIAFLCTSSSACALASAVGAIPPVACGYWVRSSSTRWGVVPNAVCLAAIPLMSPPPIPYTPNWLACSPNALNPCHAGPTPGRYLPAVCIVTLAACIGLRVWLRLTTPVSAVPALVTAPDNSANEVFKVFASWINVLANVEESSAMLISKNK